MNEIAIPAELAQVIYRYLDRCPHGEVVQMQQALRAAIQAAATALQPPTP